MMVLGYESYLVLQKVDGVHKATNYLCQFSPGKSLCRLQEIRCQSDLVCLKFDYQTKMYALQEERLVPIEVHSRSNKEQFVDSFIGCGILRQNTFAGIFHGQLCMLKIKKKTLVTAFPYGKFTPVQQWASWIPRINQACYIEISKKALLACFTLRCTGEKCRQNHWIMFVYVSGEGDLATENTAIFQTSAAILGVYKFGKRFGLHFADPHFTPDRRKLFTPHHIQQKCEFSPYEDLEGFLTSICYVDAFDFFTVSNSYGGAKLNYEFFPRFVVLRARFDMLRGLDRYLVTGARLNVGKWHFTWMDKENSNLIYFGSVWLPRLVKDIEVYKSHRELSLVGFLNEELGLLVSEHGRKVFLKCLFPNSEDTDLRSQRVERYHL